MKSQDNSSRTGKPERVAPRNGPPKATDDEVGQVAPAEADADDEVTPGDGFVVALWLIESLSSVGWNLD